MRDLGELWQRCQTGDVPEGEWEYQRYLLIENIQYFDDEIKDLSFDRGLIYDHFGIGNCISSKMVPTILPKPDYDISRNAKLELFIRIATINDGETPWIPFGTYYVQNRNQEANKLKLECYDGIRFLEVPYLDGTEQINWPIPCTDAIQKILTFLEVELDERTTLNPAFFVDSPENMTMRQVLMYIASMHGGNWYLTEENKLRLVIPALADEPLGTITSAIAKRIISSKTSTFDKVVITFGQGDEDYVTAGEGTNILPVYNPWATQAMADDILAILLDYTYNTFDLQSVDIDPALELGDTLDVGGVPINLWQVAYTLRLYANIVIPSESEAGDSIEFGGVPGSGTGGSGTAYIPKIYWDFNERPLRITQVETQIAAIDVNVTMAGNAQGQFQLTLMSDRDGEVTIRIYDNDIQELYTPTIQQIRRGFNQIGIPHPYIRLRAGLHLFTVTIQTKQGYLNIATRSVMYSIDLFAADIPPLVYDLRDVSLRQPSFALEPTDVYVIAKHAEGYPIMLRTRYVKGRRLIGSDFTLHWEFPNLAGVKELAIEFNGVFELFTNETKYTLVTDDKPHFFFTDENDVLWCQYGDETLTRVQLATNVLSISACRAWNSKEFTNQDMGLVIAYIKYDGIVAYRTKMGKATGTEVWESEEILTDAGDGNSFVHVHRLNDYRVGFSVTGCNKHFITKRTLIGAGTSAKIVHLNAGRDILHTVWHEHINQLMPVFATIEAERLSDTEARFRFNYKILFLNPDFVHNITVEKLNGDPLTLHEYHIEDEDTIFVEHSTYTPYGSLVLRVPSVSTLIYFYIGDYTTGNAFVPASTYIAEGQIVQPSYSPHVLATFSELTITHEPLVFKTYEDENNHVSLKATFDELTITHDPLNFVESEAEESVYVYATFDFVTIHHEYVGSEPL